MITSKKALISSLCAVGFSLLAVSARADFTDGLLVGWTFNSADSTALDSDLGSMSSVTFSQSGTGGNQTTSFNADGSISIGTGRLLYTTAINDTALPNLHNGLTIWARVQIDTTGASFAHVFGLSSGTTAGSTSLFTASLAMRSTTPQVTFVGRTDAPATLGAGSGWPTMPAASANEYVNVVIRVADLGTSASTYNTLVDDDSANTPVQQSGTWNGATSNLQSIAALALGRLNSSAGVGLTFDEIRLYDSTLTDIQVAQISAVSAIPEPSTFAGLAAGAAALAVGMRRRRRNTA